MPFLSFLISMSVLMDGFTDEWIQVPIKVILEQKDKEIIFMKVCRRS